MTALNIAQLLVSSLLVLRSRVGVPYRTLCIPVANENGPRSRWTHISCIQRHQVKRRADMAKHIDFAVPTCYYVFKEDAGAKP